MHTSQIPPVLLPLWPCRAQKPYLAPVTHHIKAISCFECVILALMVNEVVVRVRVCVCSCLRVRDSQVVRSSEVPGERWGPIAELWERKASCRCHIHQCNASRCVKRLCVHTSVHTSSHTIMCNKQAFAPEHTHTQFHRMTIDIPGGSKSMCEI